MLLQMVGGGPLLPDGIKIRGDIHICLMGDPGVAKSQLLKHIGHISLRAVYTTGKVLRRFDCCGDPTTSEFVSEGGCTVSRTRGDRQADEFDKMEEGIDRDSMR
jgi:DNA replication licensing factor MCM7